MSSLPLNTQFPLQSHSSTTPTIPSKGAIPSDGPLEAAKDAREIVRLAQCPTCSYPLREPVTLPCGNTICQNCIPQTHVRLNISYPATENRLEGFTCPFSSCREDHALGDCSVNVVLRKILATVKEKIDGHMVTPKANEVVLQLVERDAWAIAGVTSLRDKVPCSRVLAGGRLAATYIMAEMGELQRDSDVAYSPISPGDEASDDVDATLLEHLKESTRAELDCQICFALFLDPLTTSCGHTFCRKCLHRSLDHSALCPICRRSLSILPTTTAQQAPSNILLANLLSGLCPEAVAARAETAALEDLGGGGELDTPLFVCTLSLPTMPTFLHVFEPRYRLMMRRAMESGDRKFGMVLMRQASDLTTQGHLGPVPFYEYGTLLHIINMHLLPDGRSLIETVGGSRFRILRHGPLDGYTVAKLERVDDISIAAEEAREAAETAADPNTTQRSPTQENVGARLQHIRSASRTTPAFSPPTAQDLTSMPTREIMELLTTYVKRSQEESATWLHSRVYQAFGDCPTDPATFPWWFASVLPLDDTEKYRILVTTSVRERLKICAGWMVQIENRRRQASPSSCTVS